MIEIPLDGWCIQVFHLSPHVDVARLAADVVNQVPGATCSDGDTADAAWLAVETLDAEAPVEAVRAIVHAADPAAAPRLVSRPTVEGLLAG